jgi:predicted phage terminase large subunit-like protein
MILPNSIRLSLTRRSLARFATAVMPSYELSPAHKLMISYLEDLASGKIRNLAVITPPREGKTLLGNTLLPAYVLGKDPTERIISVSYGAELSETWGRRTRNMLQDPAFQEIFPGCKLSADSSAAYRFETTAGGEYTATGRGGPITGRGCSLLICDDLVKDFQEANSDVTNRATIDWLQSTAFTRMAPGGRKLAIATRWSERDPMGWIMQQPGWVVLHLPALATEGDPLGRQPGEALWPSHYSIEALEEIKRSIGSRNFECLYQGNTSAASGTIFKREWFRHYQQPPEKFLKITQSWDTAFKSGAQNDYSVGITIGETSNGFYLLSLVRGKWEFPELKRQVALQAEMWHPHEVLIEDRASGQSLVQELKLATTYPVIAIQVDRDKETRAQSTTGYFESGRVLFPENAPWLSALEDELASFPGGMADDQVDALCQFLNRCRGGDDLGYLNFVKVHSAELASGVSRFFSPKPKPLPVVLPAPSSSCSKCGSTETEIYGSGDTAKVRCHVCHAFNERSIFQFPCPKCGCHSNLVSSGRRCIQCGYQWFPEGTAPRPIKIPTRRNLPSGNWRN